jgi:hypothetical protein
MEPSLAERRAVEREAPRSRVTVYPPIAPVKREPEHIFEIVGEPILG